MVGLTLAAFGLITGIFQGFLTGSCGQAVWRMEDGNGRADLFDACGPWLWVCRVAAMAVVFLTLLHGPEGFVHPLLTSMLTKRVPEDAQGELQGGISAVTNLAMLFGTVFFAWIFGLFLGRGPGVAVNRCGVLGRGGVCCAVGGACS
jgi:DHA1 family tetracycline resistance protein-like MFS transporter